MASNLFGKACKFYKLERQYYPSSAFVPSLQDYLNIIRPNMDYVFDFNLSIPILTNESSLLNDIYLFNPGFNTQAGEIFDSISQNWFLASTLFYKSDLYQGIVDTDQVKSLFPNCVDITNFINNRDTICGLIAVLDNDIAIYMPIAVQNFAIFGTYQTVFDVRNNTQNGGYNNPLFSVIGFGFSLDAASTEKCAVEIAFKRTDTYTNNQARTYFTFGSAINQMNNTVFYTNLSQKSIYNNLLTTLDKDYAPPAPPEPSMSDPYAEGGNSSTSIPTGDFDDTSDPIDFPSLPSIAATDTGLITLYNPSLNEIKTLANYMWTNPAFDLSAWKKIFADPIDAILGLSIVPVAVPDGGQRYIAVGNLFTDVVMNVAAQQYIELQCGALNVNEFWSSYLDYEPYTKAEIYLPYCGVHQLSVDDIMNKTVEVRYHIDILTGSCCAYVKCGDSVLYQFIGQCSSSIPIASGDFSEIVSSALNAALAIGSLAATGGASAPFSVPEITANAVNILKEKIQKSGSLSGTGGMLGIQKPYLILTRPRQAHPANQNHYTGYPSFITENLSELSGYTEIEYIHLENVQATDTELNEIVTLLEGGVIF